MAGPRILVVEDEFITGADLQSKLQELGFDVPAVVDTGADAIKAAGELMPDLILMDITLKEKMTGIQAAETIVRQYDIPVIFLTAHSDDSTVEKAKIATPFGYLIKPVDDRALKISINMALYKKALDENIKRQQKIIRALLNATTDALFIVDRDGIILGLNESLAKRAQKVSDGLLNTSFFELIPAGAISTRLAEEVRNSANGVQKRFVEEFSARWFDNNIFPITDSDGTVTMIAVFSNDITDLKKAENDLMVAHNNLLKEKERLLVMTSALDTMDDIVIITDAMGNISYVNTSFVKKLGYTANEMQHRHIGEIQYPGDPFAIDKTAFIAKSQTAWMGNLALKNKYNLKIKTSLRSSPVMMDNRLICRVFVLREQP